MPRAPKLRTSHRHGGPMTDENRALAARLAAALRPLGEPIGIVFLREADPCLVPAFIAPRPVPNAAGRTGSVPAGCVFWMRAQDASFYTVGADHANCSVGSLTHGLLSLAEAGERDDVKNAIESGWMTALELSALPQVRETPARIVYGPLASLPHAPDVVLLRISALALMTLKDAFPELRIEGKPQCHIVAIAKESAEPAASVGCALSRARTGMRSDEVTCALPGAKLAAIVTALEAAAALDRDMARYASNDMRRFPAPEVRSTRGDTSR